MHSKKQAREGLGANHRHFAKNSSEDSAEESADSFVLQPSAYGETLEELNSPCPWLMDSDGSADGSESGDSMEGSERDQAVISPEPFECRKCSETFPSRNRLFAHLRRVHSAAKDSDDYLCLACDQMQLWSYCGCDHSVKEARQGLGPADEFWYHRPHLKDSEEESAALHITSYYSAKESVGDSVAPAICAHKHCLRQVSAKSIRSSDLCACHY